MRSFSSICFFALGRALLHGDVTLASVSILAADAQLGICWTVEEGYGDGGNKNGGGKVFFHSEIIFKNVPDKLRKLHELLLLASFSARARLVESSSNSDFTKKLLFLSLCNLRFQLFAYDTVRKKLMPKPGEQPEIPIPASLVAGVSSTLCTYPLELIKTRITIPEEYEDIEEQERRKEESGCSLL
ncbi:hypothetical protein NE237_024949 [Protea cynaroides]|uniref:Uncharacterized protein n=1 Tax=Protea cynaroides TaxID=273540 RepID=A0A9Q0H1I0_9MAGN|nr:hypothetical protein NE237_024949 [Protea cynaroides]